MKNSISQILVVLFLVISISAQTEENKPKLVDEFGILSLDDLMARIDNLAVQVGNTPKSKALIRVYGGQGNYSYVRGSVIKAIWINSHKYPPEKLLLQFCNVDKEPIRTEFFIVRENDKAEVCDENLTVPKETVLLENVYYDYYNNPKFKFEPFDNEPVYIEDSANGYSQFSQDAIKRLLNNSPDNKVYIIAYIKTNFEMDESGKVIARRLKNLDKKHLAGIMIRNARKALIKNGFLSSQIVAVDGGYVNDYSQRLEFWFVPKGGEIPKPKPAYFPKKKLRKKK